MITRGDKWLLGVSRGHRLLQGVQLDTGVDKELQVVTWGYKG